MEAWAALEEPSDDPLAAGTPLATLQQLLTIPPAPDGTGGLEFAAERRAAPEALDDVKLLLQAGPAGAVENVEELYEIGLPRGLQGGLAGVAINHRAQLVELVRRARAAKQNLEASIRLAVTTKRQGATRRSGQHDMLRTGDRRRLMAVPAGAAAGAAAAAAATAGVDDDGGAATPCPPPCPRVPASDSQPAAGPEAELPPEAGAGGGQPACGQYAEPPVEVATACGRSACCGATAAVEATPWPAPRPRVPASGGQ